MTVLDFFAMTRRGWKILVLLIVGGALVGAAYGFFAPKTYEAQSSGFIATQGTTVFAGSDAATSKAGSYLALINSKQVREAILKDTKAGSATLDGSLSARLAAGSTLIQVTATSSSPQNAQKLANGALHALATVVGEIESKTQNDGSSIEIVPMDDAVVPTSPATPNLKLAIGIGAAAGLVLGYVWLLLRRALDVRVRAHTDLRELMGTGVLARVPKLGRNGTPEGDSRTETIANEAFRQLRTGLRFSSVDSEVRVVMITSASQGEGKSMTAASLARVIAESGQRTLLVDGDLRRPKVARNFGIDGTIGLSEVLSGQVAVRNAIQPTKDPNLFVLPSGGTPPNPSEMLGSVALSNLLREFRKDFFIIIDAPPVLPVTDATVVSTLVDGVVFVLAVGQTRKAAGAAARAQLEQVHARILGIVLNMVPLKGVDSHSYGYYRQNNSYYLKPAKDKKEKGGGRRTAPAPAVVPHVPVEREATPIRRTSAGQVQGSAPAQAQPASVEAAAQNPATAARDAQPTPSAQPVGARAETPPLRRSSRS
ncbi:MULTISPECIES: polysaccharide biosynthesis tyrosine autokinase [unclassified Microbacterium]|uniref:polysaccharide biosynthesis tyrosine autokinase n=2 Tax=unclassified Microbacterium TaxID=2609290 RepID=UPI001AC5EEDE|nr:polysaccharide biosynthesis tyrosine autokinase [Microbacterium sp.]MBN9157262.1 polysaccharide biosynthesis tyrosine autokinase [Microbacterium sp.]